MKQKCLILQMRFTKTEKANSHMAAQRTQLGRKKREVAANQPSDQSSGCMEQ